jgi:hypothetical protein
MNPETYPIQLAHEPVTADAMLDTSAWCDLSDCAGVLITVIHYRGGDNDLVLDVHEGDAASGTTAVANNFQIWYASSALTDPTMVRQTDAKTFTIDTGDYTGTQVVEFYLDAANCKRYIQLGADAGHASSIVTAFYRKDKARYKGDEAY